ncbi:MAG TPA: RuBisCO large subunit C-terminal-like domain-containing protein [Candidatus Limnocylindrales bacterium]|nr:RuBisCO large subunit C-terminal-like domain-containing protein [Candidatus Limnocylindrales bacterium]
MTDGSAQRRPPIAGPEPREDVVVTYLAGLPADESAAIAAADAFALGQSLGTWKTVPGITDEMRRRHGARVVQLRRTERDEEVAGVPARGRWLLAVAFPLANLGESLAMLLTTTIGNDPSTSIAMHVVGVDVPARFVDGFPGPRFGVAGWRAITGIDDRPLLLNMIKPCTGFPPEVGAEFAAESARGGVDLIKDDELLADPGFSRVADRTRAYVAAIDAVAATTGHRTRYVAHVTTTPSRLTATARAAVEAGAAAVMVTPLTLGLDALAELAAAAGVPILAHVAGIETWTGAAEGGIAHGALARILRLAGADAVLTSTPHAPRPLSDGAYRATIAGLREPVAGGRVAATMPMAGGGITADHVDQLVAALGCDVIVAVGGAIQGHPDGAAAGGRAIQAAIAEAVLRHGDADRTMRAGGGRGTA